MAAILVHIWYKEVWAIYKINLHGMNYYYYLLEVVLNMNTVCFSGTLVHKPTGHATNEKREY